MPELKYTLIADGTSDATLLRIIKWSLDDLYPSVPNTGVIADYRGIPHPPKSLAEKIKAAKYYYPFDLLFVHRDAESTTKGVVGQRTDEIMRALEENEKEATICVVPVKMMEAWLLIDEYALKRAAGNRNYDQTICLPPLPKIEKEKDPKGLLHDLLKEVSGLKSRRLHKFNVHKAVHLLAENIEDYKPLRNLSAFNAFENNLSRAMEGYLRAG